MRRGQSARGQSASGRGAAARRIGVRRRFMWCARAGPQLLVGAPANIDAARLNVTERETTIEGERGALWLVRRVPTQRAVYLGLIRLRERGGPSGWAKRFAGVHANSVGRRDGAPGGAEGGPLRWAVIALLMGALCYGLARYVAAPALTISRAARAFAEGDYAVRVAPQLGGRRDELAELGRDFDAMAARIQTQREAERRLLGDISHELRSPSGAPSSRARIGPSKAPTRRRAAIWRASKRKSKSLGALISQLLGAHAIGKTPRRCKTRKP